MKHDSQEDKIEVLSDKVEANTKDISDIKLVSAARTEEIRYICDTIKEQSKRMDKLIDQNRALLISILLVLAGMAVWFIEYAVTH
jgi:uncharacterized coiled-coil protein SlyX